MLLVLWVLAVVVGINIARVHSGGIRICPLKSTPITITRYEKTYTMFRKCSCCGKEIDMV